MQMVYGADEDGNIELSKKLQKIMPTQIQDIVSFFFIVFLWKIVF